MGIIDILTPYDMKKKSEHYWKAMTQDKVSIPDVIFDSNSFFVIKNDWFLQHGISAVKPSEYGNRFASYMVKTIKYNEDITAIVEETAETHKKQ